MVGSQNAVSEIGDRLGRDPSTIYRDFKRNRYSDTELPLLNGYHAFVASNLEDGNAFLAGFMERYNAKSAKATAKPDNLHRALNIEPDRLAEVFCLRDKRYVIKDLMLKYDRKRIRLEVNELTRRLVGKYVDVYEMQDGRIQVRAEGVARPAASSIRTNSA